MGTGNRREVLYRKIVPLDLERENVRDEAIGDCLNSFC
jgi:hypothetical protein